jgi:hypothetical protein
VKKSRGARLHTSAGPIAVLSDTKLREVIGGRIGGPQVQMQHENQVFTKP